VNLHSDAPVFIAVQDGKHTALQVKLLLEGESVKVDYRSEPAPHIGLPEHHPSELTTPTSWLLKAREHEERNELEAAAECYRKALSLDPQCVSAMNGLAQWHLKRGEWQQAREWAQKALSVDPQNEDALWWQAMASYWDEGRGDGGRGCFALGADTEQHLCSRCLCGLGRIIFAEKRLPNCP